MLQQHHPRRYRRRHGQEPAFAGSAGTIWKLLGLGFLLAGCSTAPERAAPEPASSLASWERGISVTAAGQPGMETMTVYLWFYEWNMFDALEIGQHTHGTHANEIRVREDGRSGTVVSEPLGLRLYMQAAPDGADLELTATNRSEHAWPPLAAIIPCFNPGPEEIRNRQFANTQTYFLGPEGLVRLQDREIHYNQELRSAIDGEADAEGKYVWSFKWPRAEPDAHGGLLLRESTDGRWVAGIVWERFLSAQGHNPWECMHLSIQLGPLALEQTRKVRGKIYLFEGTKEDLLERYSSDFGRQ